MLITALIIYKNANPMKRLFFLFAFTFIGLGAFGQADNLDLLIEKKKPHLKKDWYVSNLYWGKVGLGNNFLRDRQLSDIPYRGYGFHLGILNAGYTREKVQVSLDFLLDVSFMLAAPTITPESIPVFSTSSTLVDYNFLNTDYSFRLAKTGHYIGGHFDIAVNSFSIIPNVIGSTDVFFSTGLVYTNHFNIKNIPIRVNAKLPAIALHHISKEQDIYPKPWQVVGIKNYFAPTISIDFFPLFLKKDKSFKISYVCSYANFDRKSGEYYQYRNLRNMIMISAFIKSDNNESLGVLISELFPSLTSY